MESGKNPNHLRLNKVGKNPSHLRLNGVRNNSQSLRLNGVRKKSQSPEAKWSQEKIPVAENFTIFPHNDLFLEKHIQNSNQNFY